MTRTVRLFSRMFLTVALTMITALFFSHADPARAQDDAVVLSEFIFEDAPFASCHASTIAQTRSGDLVAAWFAGTREGAPDVKIWCARRPHNAESWTEPQIVGVADDKMAPCWNPVLFQQTDGPLWLFYKQAPKIKDWQGVLMRSDDQGKTWGERRVLPEGFIGPVKNKPVELSDGSVLCPTSTEHNGWRVHFELIPDFQKTWSRTEAINSPEECGAIQPTILFHRDGRLQALCRNRDANATIWQTWSDDNGRTWSRLTPTNLPNPNSGIDAVTLRDGRQLLVYNHSTAKTGARNLLNVAVSDDGQNWNAVCVLENASGEFSYPSVIQTKDGMAHIVYTWKRTRVRHVVLDPQKIQGKPILDGIWSEEQ